MCVAQHILAALEGTEITSVERDLILKEKVLGFTLYKWNIESADQLIELNKELKALAKQAGYELILAVDHEGGRVFRLPEPFSQIPPMKNWGDSFNQTGDVEPLFELGKILGSEIKAAGFNLNFAPAVDINTNPDNPVIADRSFSETATVVYKLARQVIRGLIHENIIPCLKHFPGHGGTSLDSHDFLPLDERNLEEITKTDLLPYQSLIAENLAPTIMTAHVVFPEIDKDHPATLSQKFLTQILRNEMKYAGIIFSDDLLMKAIADNYGIYEAAKAFFLCGGDVALICKQPELSQEIIEKLKKDGDDLSKLFDCSKKRIESLKKSFLTSETLKTNLSHLIKDHQLYLNQLFPA